MIYLPVHILLSFLYSWPAFYVYFNIYFTAFHFNLPPLPKTSHYCQSKELLFIILCKTIPSESLTVCGQVFVCFIIPRMVSQFTFATIVPNWLELGLGKMLADPTMHDAAPVRSHSQRLLGVIGHWILDIFGFCFKHVAQNVSVMLKWRGDETKPGRIFHWFFQRGYTCCLLFLFLEYLFIYSYICLTVYF